MSEKIYLPNGMEAVKAQYKNFPLDEFNSNPLIQALPPLASKEDIIRKLMVRPKLNKDDLLLEDTYRIHMANRLFQLFQPLPIHIEVWNMVQNLLIDGYLARNPFDKNFIKYINQTGKKIINRSFDINSRSNFKSTSGCGLFLGYSGIGKTTTINNVLRHYPQVIVHNEYRGMYYNQIQLVWLKLEAPVNSSLKALCLQFFMRIDEVLGTNNYKKHVSRNTSVDNMLPLISQVAHNIGLGLLIIDEVQNIKKRGADQLMNFFVYLINAGINLCLIGTPSAYDLFGKELRITRRLTGNAEIIFNNMKNNEEFDFFLQSIWSFQWVHYESDYNEEFRNVFYEETQGISDLIIKLFVYAQQEAIQTGTEKLSIKLIKKIAKNKFKLLQPMLDAIRSGNPHKIAKYEDIKLLEPSNNITNKPTKKSNAVVKNTTSKAQRDSKEPKIAPKDSKKSLEEDDLRYLVRQHKNKKPYEILKEKNLIEEAKKWIGVGRND